MLTLFEAFLVSHNANVFEAIPVSNYAFHLYQQGMLSVVDRTTQLTIITWPNGFRISTKIRCFGIFAENDANKSRALHQ